MNNPACSTCHQNQYVIKSGLNHTKSQRYRCQACRRYFTGAPKPHGYDLALRKQALQIQLERLLAQGQIVAMWLRGTCEIAATGLTAIALRFGMVQAALNHVLVLVAGRASWIIHVRIITLLSQLRHSP